MSFGKAPPRFFFSISLLSGRMFHTHFPWLSAGSTPSPSKNRTRNKYLKTNENGNTQNLWDAAKAVLRGEVYGNKCAFKEKRSLINNLTLHPRD